MCERIYFPEAETLGSVISVIQQDDTDAVTAYRLLQAEERAVCVTLADIKVQSTGTTIVISENALGGAVYKHGNHGPFWEKIGRTCGYA